MHGVKKMAASEPAKKRVAELQSSGDSVILWGEECGRDLEAVRDAN